jgi:hypothetical protein
MVAKVLRGRWRKCTLIAALRHDGVTAPIAFDPPINGETLQAYVGQALLQRWRPVML